MQAVVNDLTRTCGPLEGSPAARSIVPLRVLLGALLAAHYALHFRFTAELWGPQGVIGGTEARAASVFAPVADSLLHLGSRWAQVWFALGTTLALLVAAGLALRACAVLLLIVGAVTYQALVPTVTLDDWMAQVAAFWLLLLPPARPVRHLGWGGRRSAPGMAGRLESPSSPAPGSRSAAGKWAWPELSCVAFVLIFYVEACLESPALSSAVRLSVFVACACVVAPLGRWRALAVVPAAVVALHVVQLSGAALGCALSVVLCGMSFAGMSRARAGRATSEGGSFGWAAGVGASVVAFQALRRLAILVRVPSIVQSTGSVLSAAGLAPYPGFDAQGSEISAVAFLVDGQNRVDVMEHASTNPSLRIRLGWLDDGSRARAGEKRALLDYLVTQHCRGASETDAREAGRVVLLHGHLVARPVAWFRCPDHGAAPAVVPFEWK